MKTQLGASSKKIKSNEVNTTNNNQIDHQQKQQHAHHPDWYRKLVKKSKHFATERKSKPSSLNNVPQSYYENELTVVPSRQEVYQVYTDVSLKLPITQLSGNCDSQKRTPYRASTKVKLMPKKTAPSPLEKAVA